jgi:pyruvate dehydrogenase E2 component (dihydrolipoamide acetyltransferase)
MAVAIKLPDMGTNVEECKVLAWRVREGERVKRGEVLAEIETDKAVAELESTAEGVLLRHVVKPGEPARTGDTLAYVGQPGEVVAEGRSNLFGRQMDSSQDQLERPEETKLAPPVSGPVAGGISAARAQSRAYGTGGPVRIAPVVRNLAAKLGVDLATVHGSGVGGTITREDVLRASRTAPSPGAAPPGEQLPRAQAAVARAVLRSWKEIPHLHISATIDMTAAERIRTASETTNTRPSYDAIFLKAMARACEAVPLVAAKLEGERVLRPQGIHIALAIGFANELFLPVIRDVNRKDLRTLQAEISELASRARAGTLKLDQMAGGPMALSNLGMYPVEDFEAIIFPEHSTMLAIGAVKKKPVVVDDQIAIRPVVTATLAADHRLINGRTAAEFLSKVKQIIEAGELG